MSDRPVPGPARSLSVALAGALDGDLSRHLSRADGQEDLTFALYRWSTGATRDTALLVDIVLPDDGDRLLHGDASFTGDYFLRAAAQAVEAGCGLALLHAHPGARTWQGLSPDDRRAEAGHAIQAQVITGQPLLGLTFASGNGTYSARLWPTRQGQTAKELQPRWATTVRSVGSAFKISYNPDLAPPPAATLRTMRTVDAWGRATHDDLIRLRVGIIGAGSVGQHVGEGLARTGFLHILVADFDEVAEHNLDRLLHATTADIGASKAKLLASELRRNATADKATIQAIEYSVVEPEGWLAALDCDVLFSCVDRPWPRYALNVAAYAHLIPVIDGGIAVDTVDGQLLGADWRSHMVAPGRRCMECLDQYDPGDVSIERAGLLDDPTYIEALPADHRLRRRENVFAFSMACAAAELLELFRAVVRPSGIADVGALLTHWTTATIEHDEADCEPNCPFSHNLLALGDTAPVDVTGSHPAAAQARSERVQRDMPIDTTRTVHAGQARRWWHRWTWPAR
jgi:molybdopterin-synthase adenylyltransferase